jgi:eukaryotic-like serine/threonine-protein kinase
MPTKELPAFDAGPVALDAAAEEEELVQGDFVGRYAVLSCLGRGGMGVVYKAYDDQLDRYVALKLLRRGRRSVNADLRLFREAKTLAQLKHPNVVAVYDAGLTNQGVFIAMELLSGKTVNEWLAQQTRTVQEILAVFRAAGRGLLAAHQAGFVHRDFKPGNVMVEGDGSVRVLDFGLAHLVDDPSGGGGAGELRITGSEPLAVARDQPPAEARRSSREIFATQAGLVIGTPAYMAPEQIVGDRGDHRSEQFAFAMSLYVSLYDRLPLAGETYEERRENIVRGLQVSERDLERSASGELVPPRVRQAIVRGLAREPEARFGSMAELLVELEEPARRGRLAAIAGFTLLTGFGVGAMVFDTRSEALPCSDPESALAGTWGPADRAAVDSAFVAEEAASSLPRVVAQLDGYAAAWVEMYAASCRATFITRQQSERLFDQRMRCLERRRNRLRSAIDALLEADTPQRLVERSIAPFKLPGLEPCADLEAVATEQALPQDDAQRHRIEQLRARIDEAETLYDAGAAERGLAVVTEAVVEARALAYPPVLAEALTSLGHLQASAASPKDAQATLEEAVLVAAQAGDDRTAAAAWTWLLFSLVVQDRLQDAFTLELAARAAVARARDEVVMGWLLNNLGVLHGQNKDPVRAHEELRGALEVKQRVLGPDHVDVGISWFNLGNALFDGKRNDEAQEAFRQARSIFQATVGERHPMTHFAMAGLCRVEVAGARPQVAVELCTEVLSRFEASPPSPYWQARVSYYLALAQWDAGAEAEALDSARRARVFAADDPAMLREIDGWLAEVKADGSTPPAPG